MKTKLFRAFLATLLAAFAQWAPAAFDPVNDDTDIFLANPAFDAIRPNVLILLDNTANWNSPFDVEKDALISVFNDLDDSYNVGLAMFVETGGTNDSIDGAYIKFAVRQMTATNKAGLSSSVFGLDRIGDRSNNAVPSLAMGELYRYFAGVASVSGKGKAKRDYAGNTTYNAAAASLPGNAFVSAAATTYVSPITDPCQKNFIIFISNGPTPENTSALNEAQAHLATLVAKNPPDTISINPSGEQGLWADEYAKYMANADCNAAVAGTQNIFTYTIDVNSDNGDHAAMLQSMATNGKGKYFKITDTSTKAELENALKAIFQEVQSVNSVFASTTLPVSVNVRGTNLNQVYIGVFRPDANKSPRWFGNLKLYQLGKDTATGAIFLADVNGDPAENSSTGFISANARSFWTTDSTYWSFRDPEVNGVGGDSDAPDGDQVEKGGAAQRQRIAYATSNTPRKLYTCTDGAAGLCASGDLLSATPFNTTTVTAADLDAYSTKPVVTITSAGTTATAKVTGHGWATGDIVRITGAAPTSYNGDYSITVVDADTFTYTMAAAPDASRARVTAANHELIDGDLACINANPVGYSTCWVPVARVDNSNFDYTPATPQTTPGTPNGLNWGGRPISLVVGIPGQNKIKVVLPGHGYVGTLNETYLLPGPTYTTTDPDWYWWYNGDLNTDSVVLDANTLEMPAYAYAPGPNVFGIPNAAQVTVAGHEFSTGQTITIAGATVASYNGSKLIARIDSNSFIFTSTETLADTGTAIRAGHVISSITHPSSGAAADRDTATVTTSTNHGFAVGQAVQVFGSGGSFSTTGNCTGFDTGTGGNGIATWQIQSTPSPTTFTIFHGNIDRCPDNVTTAGMLAGYAVTRIDPARIDSGNIVHWRTINVSALAPLTTAQGLVRAGRPADGDDAERDLIVNWVRSTDNKDNEDQDGDATDVRASVHGDVLHSRPAIINYSRFPADPSQPASDNDVYAFYGANDGLLRAVKGGFSSDEAGINPGDERWAFIPREFFDRLKRLREQSPLIANTTQKDYFFDGPIGVYQKDVTPTGGRAGTIGDDAGDKVHLYLSLRRGGDFVYALDVTDPGAPKLLWRKGNGDAGWGEVGDTWSEPKVTKLNWAFDPTNNPENVALVFGAGYDDAVEDINPCLLSQFNAANVVQKAVGTGTVTYTSAGSCTITSPTGSATTIDRTKGRGLLVVNAFTGEVLWQVGPAPSGALHNLSHPDMTCAIPSDITVLDRNRDGRGDRLYTGDTCGNVWRAEISDPDPENWKVTKIAALSSGTNTDIAGKRKFLFPPDLVLAKDTPPSGLSPTHYAVLIGSGDREHPFDTTVQNTFFMVKDRDAVSSTEGTINATTRSIAVPSSGSSVAPTSSSDVFDATNVEGVNEFGWKIDLNGGEKVVGNAVTISGTTFFNTNQPSATAGGGSCGSNLGIARQYLVSYVDAAATTDLNALGTLSIANRSTIHAGGGYLPSPVPIVVEIDPGKVDQVVCAGVTCREAPGLTLDTRVRTYWYKEIDQ